MVLMRPAIDQICRRCSLSIYHTSQDEALRRRAFLVCLARLQLTPMLFYGAPRYPALTETSYWRDFAYSGIPFCFGFASFQLGYSLLIIMRHVRLRLLCKMGG